MKDQKKVSKNKALNVKNCPAEFEFVVFSSGRRLKNIRELAKEIEHMADDIFAHHVNEFNNDFSNWIEHVFSEKNLADELRLMHEKAEMHLKLLKHLSGVLK